MNEESKTILKIIGIDFNDISESEITCHVDKLSIDQYFPKHNNINYTKLHIDDSSRRKSL